MNLFKITILSLVVSLFGLSAQARDPSFNCNKFWVFEKSVRQPFIAQKIKDEKGKSKTATEIRKDWNLVLNQYTATFRLNCENYLPAIKRNQNIISRALTNQQEKFKARADLQKIEAKLGDSSTLIFTQCLNISNEDSSNTITADYCNKKDKSLRAALKMSENEKMALNDQDSSPEQKAIINKIERSRSLRERDKKERSDWEQYLRDHPDANPIPPFLNSEDGEDEARHSEPQAT